MGECEGLAVLAVPTILSRAELPSLLRAIFIAAGGQHEGWDGLDAVIVLDVADLASVRAGPAAVDGSVDALVMNAGLIGPQSMDVTADGVTTGFATNVLGHVVLLEGLLAEDRLGEVAVLAGSEAARGV